MSPINPHVHNSDDIYTFGLHKINPEPFSNAASFGHKVTSVKTFAGTMVKVDTECGIPKENAFTCHNGKGMMMFQITKTGFDLLGAELSHDGYCARSNSIVEKRILGRINSPEDGNFQENSYQSLFEAKDKLDQIYSDSVVRRAEEEASGGAIVDTPHEVMNAYKNMTECGNVIGAFSHVFEYQQ